MDILSRAPNDFFSGTEVWRVRSQLVGDVFQVCVTAPDGPLPPGQRCAALYATDGGLHAGAVATMTRCLGLGQEAPPQYAISIGYLHDAKPNYLIRRNRDLTPTARPDFDGVMPMLVGQSEGVPSGGADAFLGFVLDELRPALEQAYGLDPQQATLTGSSLGGLFVCHALLARPGAFARYLAVSPALWWDERLLIERARQAVAERQAPQARLWLCAGELESLEHVRAKMASFPAAVVDLIPKTMREADMIGDMQAMAGVLAPWQGERFRVSAQVLPGESHGSIIGQALSLGLRALHAP